MVPLEHHLEIAIRKAERRRLNGRRHGQRRLRAQHVRVLPLQHRLAHHERLLQGQRILFGNDLAKLRAERRAVYNADHEILHLVLVDAVFIELDELKESDVNSGLDPHRAEYLGKRRRRELSEIPLEHRVERLVEH